MLSKNSYGGIPSHIPNLEVKPINAESTWREASWEDKYLLSFFYFLYSLLNGVGKKINKFSSNSSDTNNISININNKHIIVVWCV